MAAPPPMPADRHLWLHNLFTGMDADQSGFVDKEEFLSIFPPGAKDEQSALERFEEIDNVRGRGGDADGQLSEAEFVDFITLQDADQLSINFSGKAATVRDIIQNSILWPMPAESQVGLGVGLEQDEETGSVVIAEIIPVSLGKES